MMDVAVVASRNAKKTSFTIRDRVLSVRVKGILPYLIYARTLDFTSVLPRLNLLAKHLSSFHRLRRSEHGRCYRSMAVMALSYPFANGCRVVGLDYIYLKQRPFPFAFAQPDINPLEDRLANNHCNEWRRAPTPPAGWRSGGTAV